MLTFKHDGAEYDIKDVLGMVNGKQQTSVLKIVEFFDNLFEMNKRSVEKYRGPDHPFEPAKEPKPIQDGVWTVHFV